MMGRTSEAAQCSAVQFFASTACTSAPESRMSETPASSEASAAARRLSSLRFCFTATSMMSCTACCP